MVFGGGGRGAQVFPGLRGNKWAGIHMLMFHV